jgi:hypothetical protein
MPSDDRQGVPWEIPVPSTDPEKEEKPKGEKKEKPVDAPEMPDMVGGGVDSASKVELMSQSEEDLQLKAELEMLVERLKVCLLCFTIRSI